MNNLTLEQHLNFCDKYLITPNELLLLEIILLHQEGDAPEIVYNYFNASTDARGMMRPMLERLQHVGIITKAYKIPEKGERLDLNDITLNKTKIKDNQTGEELNPDEEFMRSIEEQLGITQAGAKGFRQDVTAYMFSIVRNGGKVDYSSYEPLKEAIEKYIYYYNNNRYQEKLGCLSPMEYHELMAA